MRKKYASKLTVEMIKKSGITEVTKDGRIFKGPHREMGYFTKGGKYKYIDLYAFDENGNHIKRPSKTASYGYSMSRTSFHRIVYAWFYGEVPEGYVVDHIDNNPLNNNLDNLQLLTPRENLVKQNIIKKAKYEPHIKRGGYSEEYLDTKINEFAEKYARAKAEHNKKDVRKYLSSLAQWKRRKAILKEKKEDEHVEDRLDK